MSESTYRVKRKGYTVVFREVAQDSRLSLKARGLFLLMMSLPDTFTLSQSRLAKLAGAGRDQIRAALKELENVGYLIVEQSHDSAGKFAQSTYVLQEQAPNPPPLSGFPTTDKPSTENPTVLDNTICINTPLPPQGETACDSENETAVADDKPAVPRAAASHCRRPRYDPAWKPDRFERFWQFYKSHSAGRPIGNRIAAAKAWDKLKADDNLINIMGLALMRQTEGEMWKRGVGVPYASSWLNKRYWENDVPDAPAPDSAPADSFMPDDLIGG